MARTGLGECAALTELGRKLKSVCGLQRVAQPSLSSEHELTSGSIGQRERRHPSASGEQMEPMTALSVNLISTVQINIL